MTSKVFYSSTKLKSNFLTYLPQNDFTGLQNHLTSNLFLRETHLACSRTHTTFYIVGNPYANSECVARDNDNLPQRSCSVTLVFDKTSNLRFS